MGIEEVPDVSAMRRKAISAARRAEIVLRHAIGSPLPWPVYIVLVSALPKCQQRLVLYACTGPALDLYFRDDIPNYRGRGPCLLINDFEFAACPPLYHSSVTALAIHEAAHVLVGGWEFEDDAAVELAPRVRRAMHSFLTERPASIEIEDEIESDHGPDWIRCSIHLWHRSKRLMRDLSLAVVLKQSLPAWDSSGWALSLGDELERFERKPIRDVLREPIPDKLQSMWKEAVDLMRDTGPTTEQITMSVSTILEKIGGALSRQAASDEQQLRDLAIRIADGETVEPDRAAQIVRKAGRTGADLQAAVERIVKRREAKQKIDEADRAQIEDAKSRIMQEQDMAKQEYESAVAAALMKLQQKTAANRSELSRLESLEGAAGQAQAYLISTSTEAFFDRERLTALTTKRSQLVSELADARSSLQACEYTEGLVERKEFVSGPSTQQQLRMKSAALATIKNAGAALAEIEAEIAELQDQEATAAKRHLIV